VELVSGLLNIEDRVGLIAGRRVEFELEVLVVVPLRVILGFGPTLAEVVALVDVLVGLLGEGGDTASSGVRIRKESRNKDARLSRLITVRVCCPLGSVGDLYASVVD